MIIAFVVSAALPADASTSASCFRDKINAERASVGRTALVVNSQVVQIAQRHSERMEHDNTIYHNNNLAGEYAAIGGYEYGGENVGMGPDCETIHEAFKHSKGHYLNMVDPDYKQVGVAVVIGDDGTLFVTEDFFTPKVRRPSRSQPQDCR